MIPAHTINRTGKWKYSCTLNFGTAWRWGVILKLRPLYSYANICRWLMTSSLKGCQRPQCTVWGRESSLAMLGNEQQFFGLQPLGLSLHLVPCICYWNVWNTQYHYFSACTVLDVRKTRTQTTADSTQAYVWVTVYSRGIHPATSKSDAACGHICKLRVLQEQCQVWHRNFAVTGETIFFVSNTRDLTIWRLTATIWVVPHS